MAEDRVVPVPDGALAALRTSLQGAAAGAEPAAREVLALCEAVLLRLAVPAEAPDAAAAEVRRRFASLDAADPAERAAAWTALATAAGDEAARLAGREAAVAAAAASGAPTPVAVPSDAIERWLTTRFPAHAARVLRCTPVPGGRSKLTAMLTIEGPPDLAGEVVLRADRPGAAQETSVRDEFGVLQAMWRAGAAAPQPLWLENGPDALGAPFLLMRRMPGTALGDYWGPGSAGPEHARALAAVLAGLHRVDPRAAWPAAPATARECAGAMVRSAEARWRAAGASPSVALECAFGWLETRLATLDGAAVPVHGDVHFANVLYVGERVSCLTDWEFAHPGHPAEDLAFCRSYVEQVLPWPEFLARYVECGGRAVCDDELAFFRIWTYLRNTTLCAVARRRVLAGEALDVRTVAVALSSGPRLEALLAKAVAAELAAHAPGAPARGPG